MARTEGKAVVEMEREYTDVERRVLGLLTRTPYTGLDVFAEIRKQHGHGAQPATSVYAAPVTLEFVADFLEALIPCMHDGIEVQTKQRDQLAQMHRDIEGLRRIFGVRVP